MASQVLGGYLCSLIGAKRVIFGAILLSSLLTVVSPLAARFSVIAFITSRVLIGFTQVLRKYINLIVNNTILGLTISRNALGLFLPAYFYKRFIP
jgi:MFS family permease